MIPEVRAPALVESPYSISRRSQAQNANPIRELLKLVDNPRIMSFAGGLPDPALFPREAFEEALVTALSSRTIDPLQYGMTTGSVRLRERLARMMLERYGVACSAANIILTTGSQQAIDLSVRVLHDPGDQVAVQTPTYMGALQVFRAAGAGLVDFDELAANGGLPRVALGYLIPDFCNPTGLSLSDEQRRMHLEMARQGRYMLLEDAAYIELNYDGPRRASLLAMDCEENGSIENARTLFLGTFSKTLMPGLRVGWACGPSEVIARMGRMKESADILSPQLMQEAACLLLDSIFDTHVETVRRTYHARRDAMMTALGRHMPDGVSWTRPGGGMFTWLSLPEHLDSDALLARCVDEVGLAYVPGRHFMARNPVDNVLRMSFSVHAPERIEAAIAPFGAFIRSVTGPER